MAWNGSSLGQAAVLQSGARCHGVSLNFGLRFLISHKKQGIRLTFLSVFISHYFYYYYYYYYLSLFH